MKKFFTLVISLLLFIALIHAAGCKKAEEPKREVSAVPREAPVSPKTSIPPSTPQKPEAPIPSETVISAPPQVPPPVAPAAPGVPTISADKGVVYVAGFDSAKTEKGVPVGWLLDRKKGATFLRLERGSDIYCLHMYSNESSFGLKKGIKVNIKEYPYLNWRWKVTRLPSGGDVRKTGTDDQAFQLYVAFTPTGYPEKLFTPVLGYIWDNKAPKGWTGRSTQIGGGKLRYVVVRNNTDKLGEWYTEKRNIYDDYKTLLKDVKSADPPGVTHGVEFYINSQNTRSVSESYICEVYFSKK
ncbi:MAG TPA: DUF3047 domain-containing protein [Syntrophales bacterium]|nr:DUF3047 domain-containing protein [Syntrophales bacterium]